jgi:hypothetical protein
MHTSPWTQIIIEKKKLLLLFKTWSKKMKTNNISNPDQTDKHLTFFLI